MLLKNDRRFIIFTKIYKINLKNTKDVPACRRQDKKNILINQIDKCYLKVNMI